ncbi:uncharacterized protein [Oscarella lobularis]|uniref:uncharacterized protein isoform X2 n=1 Tax=Oscarella lobularis TaxID=121494 RepID=UPI003313FC9A
MGERQLALELLQKLAYSRSPEEYEKNFEQLRSTAPRSVFDYFCANWHGIRSQWVEGLKNSHGNFLTNTNNRLEAINQKLKSVIKRYSPKPVFFHDLMTCIAFLQAERKHRALSRAVKVPASHVLLNDDLKLYEKYLTPFAFNHVEKQFNKIPSVQFTTDSSTHFLVQHNDGHILAAIDSCSCAFFESMKLPCKHIFAARRRSSLSMYSEDLYDVRWTNSHYRSKHYAFHGVTADSTLVTSAGSIEANVLDEGSTAAAHQQTLTEQQKYRIAFKIAQKTAESMSHLGSEDFFEYLKKLKSVNNLIMERKPIYLKSEDEECSDGNMDDVDGKSKEDSEGTEFDAKILQKKKDGSIQEGTERRTLSLKLPPPMLKRGRPKGADLTVIGLPSSKRRKSDQPLPFKKKSPHEKEKTILEWFVEKEVAHKAMHDKVLIEEEFVETRPERVPMKCTADDVAIHQVKKYFSFDGWKVVMNVYEVLKERGFLRGDYFLLRCSWGE